MTVVVTVIRESPLPDYPRPNTLEETWLHVYRVRRSPFWPQTGSRESNSSSPGTHCTKPARRPNCSPSRRAKSRLPTTTSTEHSRWTGWSAPRLRVRRRLRRIAAARRSRQPRQAATGLRGGRVRQGIRSWRPESRWPRSATARGHCRNVGSRCDEREDIDLGYEHSHRSAQRRSRRRRSRGRHRWDMVTSRSPDDLPAFSAAVIDAVAVARRRGR